MIIKAAKAIPLHFGPKAQWIGSNSKLAEEQKELIEALIDHQAEEATDTTPNLIDEVADVLFLVIQIIVWYKLSPIAIYKQIKYKAKRTLERIKSNYYGVKNG
jgi:phosphoribosyl-ATP pyrophosphohydrolase